MQQPCSDYNDSCSNVIYQTVNVGLPISLTPLIDVGEIKIKCCGKPCVELRQAECGNGDFEVFINQTVIYKIPVQYSMKANKGEVNTKCEKNYM